jgi:acetyl esterase/lipase
MRILAWVLVIVLGLTVSGCKAVVARTGIAILYKKADLPATQVRTDITYVSGSTSPKQQLDLFLPSGQNWPVFIFIHGGGWTSGDKGLRVGGADVYANIGRFFADNGIGVAVINYRLEPEVGWKDEVDDVAQATAWVHFHIAEYGGDPQRVFVGGHSAGAQLAARIGLDPLPLAKYGLSPSNLCGVISISGAGLDLTDIKTYKQGAPVDYYEKRFGKDYKVWRKASPVTYAQPGAPPFLILYAGGENKGLPRQAQRLSEVLSKKGIENHVVVVPGQGHARIVLTLSRPDKTAGPAMLDFIRTR